MEESRTVVVVGRNSLLNEFIAFVVRADRGQGAQVEIREELPPLGGPVSPSLVLVDDCDCTSKTALLQCLGHERGARPGVTAALFNVDPRKPGIHEAVRGGVRGIFYSTTGVPDMLKGVQMLLKGEICVPTEILVDLAMNRVRPEHRRAETNDLTLRELEILARISTGARNDEIASDLFISPHTVKTHIYNIFRKIGVRNRLHAALWATQNLSSGFPREAQAS